MKCSPKFGSTFWKELVFLLRHVLLGNMTPPDLFSGGVWGLNGRFANIPRVAGILEEWWNFLSLFPADSWAQLRILCNLQKAIKHRNRQVFKTRSRLQMFGFTDFQQKRWGNVGQAENL